MSTLTDSDSIAKHQLLGWLIAKGVTDLPFNATVQQIFDALGKMAALAQKTLTVPTSAAPTPQPADSALANSNPMNTFDVSKLTAAEAAELFEMRIEEIQVATKCSVEQATRRAAILYEDLRAQIKLGKTGMQVALENAAPPLGLANSDVPALPVFGPQIKAGLGLPQDADDLECRAAWIATKGRTTPRDNKAIWKALSAVWAGYISAETKHTATEIAIEHKMRERFPELARMVSEQ